MGKAHTFVASAHETLFHIGCCGLPQTFEDKRRKILFFRSQVDFISIAKWNKYIFVSKCWECKGKNPSHTASALYRCRHLVYHSALMQAVGSCHLTTGPHQIIARNHRPSVKMKQTDCLLWTCLNECRGNWCGNIWSWIYHEFPSLLQVHHWRLHFLWKWMTWINFCCLARIHNDSQWVQSKSNKLKTVCYRAMQYSTSLVCILWQ